MGEAIINHLYAPGDDGRIPVVAVTGTNGKTTTARLIAHLFATTGLRVGMTNTDGVHVNGRQIDSGDCSGPKSARSVLMNPEVDAAVFETARGRWCCAKAWASTAARWPWSPTSAVATTWG